MRYKLETDTHHEVGPVIDLYDHEPVTTISGDVHVCLDCGYTAADTRMFAHEPCERADNGIATTWREHLDNAGYPEGFETRTGAVD